MTSTRAIRAAIVECLRSVPDVGVVHDRERNAASQSALKELYWTAGLGLRGWFVRRIVTAESGNRQAHTVEEIGWRIAGFMAFDDARESELTFDDLIEGVRNAFARDETLGGIVAQCTSIDPDGPSCIQLDDAGPVMFAGVLCHAARLRLHTIRYLDRMQ